MTEIGKQGRRWEPASAKYPTGVCPRHFRANCDLKTGSAPARANKKRTHGKMLILIRWREWQFDFVN